MKYFALVVFVALCATVALAAPTKKAVFSSGDAEIVRSESDVGPESFSYFYEQTDGQKAEAVGHLNNVGSEDEAISVKGSFQFVGDDGQTYQVNYIADENGFQPSGAHFPVPPEA